jgi:hypothetical protein
MGGMQVYWLLVEAQNYFAAVGDTQDLSTMRGGSAAMRLGIRAIDENLRKSPGLTVENATVGGSFGIWRLEGVEQAARSALAAARRTLRTEAYRHSAFSVVLTLGKPGEAFSSARARLKSVATRQRHSEARTAYPDAETMPFVAVCPVDFVRPVPQTGTMQRHPDGEYAVSRSVDERRRLGMRSKQSVLEQVTGRVAKSPRIAAILSGVAKSERPFALQIASISEPEAPDGTMRPNLKDKVAVIHLDGNGFGKIQDATLAANDTLEGQHKFDGDLQVALGTLIVAVLETVVEGGGIGAPALEELQVRAYLDKSKPPVTDVVRFETLLWGGDEIMFIVPARLGWRVAETIAKVVETLAIGVDTVNGETKSSRLHFAVGMVFCHHDAPIARIKTLADDLAAIAKRKASGADGSEINGRDNTRFVPVIMESFDHSGGNTNDLMIKRAPARLLRDERIAGSYMTLSASELGAIRTAAEALRGTDKKPGPLSRGRLRLLARLVQNGGRFGTKNARDIIEESAGIAQEANVLHVMKVLDGELWTGRFWRLLEEYWDYLLPLQLQAEIEEGVNG